MMSIAHTTSPELDSGEWNTLEQILSRFEDDRKRGLRPAVEDYVPAVEPLRQSVLFELVVTELEYRLKDGEPARVEEYMSRFPELKGDASSEPELIRAELFDRVRREPDLTLDEFLARFPQHDAMLRSIWTVDPWRGRDASARLPSMPCAARSPRFRVCIRGCLPLVCCKEPARSRAYL